MQEDSWTRSTETDWIVVGEGGVALELNDQFNARLCQVEVSHALAQSVDCTYVYARVARLAGPWFP